MKDLFKDFLFNKHILVAVNVDVMESFPALIGLAEKTGIMITKGYNLASMDLIKYAANKLGEYVPYPFYLGFPESVKSLSQNQLLYDQLLHYARTYGMDDFSEVGHSMFEERYKRIAFKEDFEPKKFEILTEADAIEVLKQAVNDLLGSSRPLSEEDYLLCKTAIEDYKIFPKTMPCKQTVVKLFYDTKNTFFMQKFMQLPDVIKLVDYINYTVYGNENLKKLNLRNKDRKLIAMTIDYMFCKTVHGIEECFEKRKIWCGLLHHIHYKPKTAEAADFVSSIREGENKSAYSRFEKLMEEGRIGEAARFLNEKKGSSVVIRNLNYLLSRCKTDDEVREVLKWVS